MWEVTKDLAVLPKQILVYKLTIKLSKCALFQDLVSFLGTIVFSAGHKSRQRRKRLSKNWQTPSSLGVIRSFIRTCTFLINFKPSLSAITSSLYATAARSSFEWNQKYQQEFEAVNILILFALVIRHADSNRSFVIACDASYFAIASVLLQAENKGVKRPVGYFSRKLAAEEIKTIIYDEDLIEVVEFLSHCRYHLIGAHHEFTFRTDHKALLYYRQP